MSNLYHQTTPQTQSRLPIARNAQTGPPRRATVSQTPAQTDQRRQELAKQAQGGPPWKAALQERQQSIEDIVPGNPDQKAQYVARLLKSVDLSMAKVPSLAHCTPRSLVYSVTLIATMGLELGGPMAEAHLVPYNDECQPALGYRGLIKLCKRGNPELLDISAYDVREGDTFDHWWGTDPGIEHRPSAGNRAASPVTHAYAVATFRGTNQKKFLVLDRSEIEDARANSPTGDSERGPWRNHYAAMAMKTAIHRLAKTLPMSAEAAALLGQAIEADPTMGFRAVDGTVVTERQSRASSVLGKLSTDSQPPRQQPEEPQQQPPNGSTDDIPW